MSWVIKLALPVKKLGIDENLDWVKTASKFMQYRCQVMIVGPNLNIEGFELTNSDMCEFLRYAPPVVRKEIVDHLMRTVIYLRGVFGNEQIGLYGQLCLLQKQKDFVIPTEDWKPWHCLPTEDAGTYYRRIKTIVPLQHILLEIKKSALNGYVRNDFDIQVVYEDVMLNVASYIDALKCREQPRVRNVIRRIIARCTKIRELTDEMDLDIINNNLESFK